MAKNQLKERILQNSKIENTSLLSESTLFSDQTVISTPIPMLNIALSGRLKGGLLSGVTMIAGPSKNFKTAFGLLLVSSFLKKHPDGVVLFYDSEFGSNETYYKLFGINPESIVHTPITNVEEFKNDIVTQLKETKRGDPLMILVDSIGALASLKEASDAEEGRQVADMTRAKSLKSLFRIITPHLTLKNIPLVVINHTYKEIGLYPKDIVSGGTGAYYSANDIWILGRQQDKDGTELQGYNFVINIEKSRTVKEKSKISIKVSFEHGIDKWSGLFDNAMEGEFITSPKKGWYQVKGDKTNYRRHEIEENDEYWEKLLQGPFADFLEQKYRLGGHLKVGETPSNE